RLPRREIRRVMELGRVAEEARDRVAERLLLERAREAAAPEAERPFGDHGHARLGVVPEQDAHRQRREREDLHRAFAAYTKRIGKRASWPQGGPTSRDLGPPWGQLALNRSASRRLGDRSASQRRGRRFAMSSQSPWIVFIASAWLFITTAA